MDHAEAAGLERIRRARGPLRAAGRGRRARACRSRAPCRTGRAFRGSRIRRTRIFSASPRRAISSRSSTTCSVVVLMPAPSAPSGPTRGTADRPSRSRCRRRSRRPRAAPCGTRGRSCCAAPPRASSCPPSSRRRCTSCRPGRATAGRTPCRARSGSARWPSPARASGWRSALVPAVAQPHESGLWPGRTPLRSRRGTPSANRRRRRLTVEIRFEQSDVAEQRHPALGAF